MGSGRRASQAPLERTRISVQIATFGDPQLRWQFVPGDG